MLIIAKKRLRTEVRRGQIVEAAQKIILESGSENVTIKAIAVEVGISDGAVYRHFQSKSDIFSFMLDEISESLLGGLEKSHIPDGRVVDHLHSTFLNQVSISEKQHTLFRVIAEITSLGDLTLNQKLRDILSTYVGCVRNLLLLGVRTGEIREDINLDSAALFFYGMVESISNYWTLSGETYDREETIRPAWDLFQRAVARSQR
jgi:AcrR family transcriptional regulator